MKRKVFASIALLALLTACNDDYNDQFNIKTDITDVKNISMTLSASDYGSIVDLAKNQEIALAKDPENKTFVEALNAVKTNKYFTEEAPAEDYLPAYVGSKYPNADAGSNFIVTYELYQTPSAYLADFKNISSYNLTADDYKTVWSDKVNASYLSPSTLSRIPSLLKDNVTGVANGDMVAVNYAYSILEPSTGGGSGEDVSYTALSDVIANTAGGEYTVKGEVIATYGRGFLLSDKTASVLVYLNAISNFSVGDIVSVSGKTSQYSGLMQFPANSEVILLERSETFSYPSAVETLDGAGIDDLSNSPLVKYVRFNGKLSISGNYYNIIVEGATRQGSISYPLRGVVDSELNDQDVTVTGYFIGSSSKFANIMATSVTVADAAPENTPIGVVALSEAGDYTVTGVVAATYARGFLLTDGTGNILVYKSDTGVKKGNVVTVKGATSAYAGLKQYSNTAEVEIIDAEETFTNPAPRALDAIAMEAYLTAPYVAHVAYEGTLSISGNYYNVIIDGSSVVQGSLSYPEAGIVDAELNGKKVIVTGYSIGVSSGKFFNTMVTSVEAATPVNTLTNRSITRASTVATNASSLYVYDGAGWKEYTTDKAKVAVVDQTVYESLGANYLESPETVLPLFLNQKYPYAGLEDKVAVVYNKSTDVLAVVEYTMGDNWAKTPNSVPTTITLTKSDTGISAQTDVYLNTGFDDGDEGGFIFQDISLSGVTYVWKLDSYSGDYYWKAAAYKNNENNPAESWLVSPVINLKKAIQPEFNFDHAHKFLGDALKANHMSILISKDYVDDVTKATWEALTVDGWGSGDDWTMVNSGKIDLSAYVGMEVRIAFKYVSTSATAPQWEVSKVVVREKVEEETPAN